VIHQLYLRCNIFEKVANSKSRSGLHISSVVILLFCGAVVDEKVRNRNLFYIACSRPKNRLALLFTQKLSDKGLSTIHHWFGENIAAI
jgi:hypothetical protein